MPEIDQKTLAAIVNQQSAINIQIVRCLVDAARAANVPQDSPLLAAIDELLNVLDVQMRTIQSAASMPDAPSIRSDVDV